MALTNYGKWIRKIRVNKGVLRYHMAKELGVKSSYLSSVETGITPLTVDFLERVKELSFLEKKHIQKIDRKINLAK